MNRHKQHSGTIGFSFFLNFCDVFRLFLNFFIIKNYMNNV